MKKYIIGVVLALSAGVVYANCVTNTTFSGGRMIVCTICCYSGNCTTTCF
jgi:predicted small secreted protein